MNKEEILDKLKTVYDVSKEWLGKHKNASAFLGGVVVGLTFGFWIG